MDRLTLMEVHSADLWLCFSEISKFSRHSVSVLCLEGQFKEVWSLIGITKYLNHSVICVSFFPCFSIVLFVTFVQRSKSAPICYNGSAKDKNDYTILLVLFLKFLKSEIISLGQCNCMQWMDEENMKFNISLML